MNTPRATTWMVLAAVAAMPLGCIPLAGRIAWMFEPAQKVKPLYTLPAGKTVLVFVDDLLNPLAYQPIRVDLTERLNATLIQKKLVADTVPYETIVDWMSRTPNLDRLSVSEIGKALGAEVILYVHVDKFALKDDERGPLWHGQMAVTVRVVDAATGRLWPLDSPEGYALPRVETASVDDSSPTYGDEIARELAEKTTEAIVNLFCEHTVPASEPSPGLGA